MIKFYSSKYSVLYLQIFSVLTYAFICLLSFDQQAAYSAVLGGVAAIVPNIYYVLKCSKLTPGQSPITALKNFYLSQAIKFIGSIVLIILILHFFPVKSAPFLLGFIIAILAATMLPFVYRKK